PSRVGQPVDQPKARRGQGAVDRVEDELLQEVGGEVETGADVALFQPRLAGEQEGRQGQHAVLVGLAGGPGDGAAGLGTDVDQVVGGPGGGALGEVEAE